MNNLDEILFSPLGKEWCLYYYFLLIFAFLTFLITCVTSVMSLTNATKFTFSGLWSNTIAPVLYTFVLYFIARLGYSICIGALGK